MLSRDAKPTRSHDWDEAAQYFDFGLHLSIAEFCGNTPMKVSIRRCWMYKTLNYELAAGRRAELKTEYFDHLAILSAVAEGDCQRAHDEMEKHLTTARAIAIPSAWAERLRVLQYPGPAHVDLARWPGFSCGIDHRQVSPKGVESRVLRQRIDDRIVDDPCAEPFIKSRRSA